MISLLKMSLADYDIANLLGKGTFGEVFLAQTKKNPDKLYAVKKIRDMAEDGYYDVIGIKETEFYIVVREHGIPNVVHMEESLIHPDEFNTYIVMEACMGGSLDGLLRKDSYNDIGIKERLTMWSNYAIAFRDMHSLGMYHLDIKTENILCKNENSLVDSVICDGSNVVFSLKNFNMDLPTIPFISATYRPPEFTTYTDMSSPDKADVWSLGILFLEMFGGEKFVVQLNNDCDKFADSVQPELKKYRNLLNNKNKTVNSMHIAKDLNKEKDELNDRLWVIHYTANLLEKLKKVNIWDAYISKNEIYRCAEPSLVSMVKNMSNFVQKYILTGTSANRITAQQLCEVLERNLKGKIDVPWHLAPNPKFIDIAKTMHDDTVWADGFIETILEKTKTVRMYRGGQKQDITPEFIFYVKALCDYYITNTDKLETNIQLTFGACLLLAGEIATCDIRRKELIALGILPESHYEDYEQVLKTRIKKVYTILRGKLAYIVSK